MFRFQVWCLSVLALFVVALSNTSDAHADNPVIMLHGFNAFSGTNCGPYFDNQLTSIVSAKGAHNVHTIGWYKYDKQCTDYLPWSQRNDNDRNTPIIEIAWELSVWIYDNYTVNGQAVDIVAHSLGGLITREMISAFGNELLIDNVVTLATPHNGVSFSWPAFAGCTVNIGQCLEAEAGSDFIRMLEHNPQSAVSTKWTLIGTKRDGVIGPETSVDMDRAGTWKPSVSKYEYPRNYRDSTHCAGYAPIGHGDMVRDNPTGKCTYYWWGGSRYYSKLTPTDRVLNAL